MLNCSLCMFSTNRSIDMKRHNETRKHIVRSYEFELKQNKNDLNLTYVFQNVKNDKENNEKIQKNPEKHSNVLQNGDIDICHKIDNFEICQLVEHEKKPKKKLCSGSKKISNSIKNDLLGDIENDSTKRFICECNKEYSSRQNLWKHKQKCNHKDTKKELNELKTIVIEMQKTINKLTIAQKQQPMILQKVDQVDQLPNQLINTNSNNLTNTNSNNVVGNTVQNNNQKVINVYQYISSNFDDAPNITMLEKKDVNKLLKVDKNIKHSIEDLLVFNQSKYKLDSFLGEIIKNAYKKEDPEEQQFWTSNIKKLTFIVRQILNKTDKTWLQDNRGSCLTKHIIEPLLKEIKKLLQKYIKLSEKNLESKSLEEIEKSQNKGMLAVKIIYDINDKSLHKKILRYIAPLFQLEQTNLLI